MTWALAIAGVGWSAHAQDAQSDAESVQVSGPEAQCPRVEAGATSDERAPASEDARPRPDVPGRQTPATATHEGVASRKPALDGPTANVVASPAAPTAPARPSAPELSAGALSGAFVVSPPDLGAASWVDLWVPLGWVRLGGAMGLVAVSSTTAARSQYWMPVGPSVAFEVPVGLFALSLRAAGGAWFGGVDDGLRAGAWLLGGGRVQLRLNAELALAAGLDVVVDFGRMRQLLWSPSLGLVWLLQRKGV